jgi:hypothetical protein
VRAVAVVAALLLGGLVGLALASEGDPESGFNGGHPVVVAAGPSGSSTELYAAAKQANGDVVVVGATDGGNGLGFGTWVVERYTTSGQLDAGFGSGGVVTLNLGGSATGVVVQPSDQRIVVGGSASGGAAEFVRLNTDGSPDHSFGAGGTGEVALTRANYLVDAAGTLKADPSGNLFLAGQADDTNTSALVGVIASVNSSGTPSSWDTGGILAPAMPSGFTGDGFSAVAIAGGDIFYDGSVYDSHHAAYGLIGGVNASSGAPVTSFGAGGSFVLGSATTLNDLLFAADGKLKATGYAVGSGPGTGALIASFSTSGADPMDTGFGSGGTVVVGGAANQPNNGNAIAELNGALYVASTAVLADSSTQPALVGVAETSGALDSALGSGGFRIYTLSHNAYSTLLADPGGLLLLGGVVDTSTQGIRSGFVSVLDAGEAGSATTQTTTTETTTGKSPPPEFDLSVEVRPVRATRVDRADPSLIGHVSYEVLSWGEGYEVTWQVEVTNSAASKMASPDLPLVPADPEAFEGLTLTPFGSFVVGGEGITRLSFGATCEVGDHPEAEGHDLVKLLGGRKLSCSVASLAPGEHARYFITTFVRGVFADEINKAELGLGADVDGHSCAELETDCNNNHPTVYFSVDHPFSDFLRLRAMHDGALKGDDVDAGSSIRGASDGASTIQPIPRYTGRNWVAAVQVAILRDPGGARLARVGCEWVAGLDGRLTSVATHDGLCDAPVWLAAKLSGHDRPRGTWTLKLRRRLPAAGYTLITRAVNRFGLADTGFASAERNLLHISAGQCRALGLCA